MYHFGSSILKFSAEINQLPKERECLTNNKWLNDLVNLQMIEITGHLNK